MKTRFLIGSALAFAASDPSAAQVVTTPVVNNESGGRIRATPVITVDTNGAYVAGGGGGGGDASAANQTSVQAPIAPATATATKSLVVGTVYNSTPPTFTNGQQGAFQMDSSGRIITNCGAGCSGGTQYAEDAASASGNTGTLTLAVRAASPANTSGTDGDYEPLQVNAGALWVKDSAANTALGVIGDTAWASGNGSVISLLKAIAGPALDTAAMSVKIDQTTPGTTNLVNTYGFAGTATTTITRPADTTAYTANDSFGDSTGGHTLSSMCRASGGSGILTDATFVYSTTQVVAGTVFIYDASITETDDNAAWSVSDADQLKLVATIPFVTVADAVNSYHNVQNLNLGYTCVGTANLRYQVKVTTGYTPAASDTLTIRAKFIQSN